MLYVLQCGLTILRKELYFMNVYLNQISGINDAIAAMYMSKRSWTRDLDRSIRYTCRCMLDYNGFFKYDVLSSDSIFYQDRNSMQFRDWMDKLCKYGPKHITLLKFIDLSFTVEGMHRGGQDDWDSHAQRFDNRIIRTSTRLSEFEQNEMSDFYKEKILTTDEAVEALGIEIPEYVVVDDKKYVKATNGYILEEFKDDKDVKRGLYMLSIPSTFIYRVNLASFAHVYKERNKDGTANPEVKECCEKSCDMLEYAMPFFNRKFLSSIEN